MEHLDIIFERYEIATSRIREIINEDTVSEPFKSFFCKASEFICKIDDLNSIIKSGEINDFSLDRLKELNKSLFEEIFEENITKEDILNLVYKKEQLIYFDNLLNNETFFEEEKIRLNISKDESLW